MTDGQSAIAATMRGLGGDEDAVATQTDTVPRCHFCSSSSQQCAAKDHKIITVGGDCTALRHRMHPPPSRTTRDGHGNPG